VNIWRTVFVITIITSAAIGNGPQEVPSKRSGIDLELADYAKLICSAVFVSGRELEEAKLNSGPLVTSNSGASYSQLSEVDRITNTEVSVDRKQKLVRVRLRDSTRTARFFGDQGCVILPKGTNRVFFKPSKVKNRLPDAMSQTWPMGDLLPKQAPPPELDAARLSRAVDVAFSDPKALSVAFVVLYKGQIVAERYAFGVNKDTLLEGWSMGKSLLAALVGILIKDGEFGLYDPAPVPEWQRPGDPRSAIRIADLLRMSSGLHFTSPLDPDFSRDTYPDHDYIYTGAINAFEFAYRRPLQFPPNSEGRYRNSDPLTLGYIVKQTVKRRGEDYFSFPQRALFDQIGIRKMVLEPDPYGNILLTGYDYGTARDWARLGLLYLWDGVWEGKRILPKGFVEFVRTPAPAWKEPVYGGLFWLNRISKWNLPIDAYYMSGEGGKVFIVPSLDLVVVRMGHEGGEERGLKILNLVLGELRAAIRLKQTSEDSSQRQYRATPQQTANVHCLANPTRQPEQLR
jgi:CubicO group peptidase (beta-lactamase class C family)